MSALEAIVTFGLSFVLCAFVIGISHHLIMLAY